MALESIVLLKNDGGALPIRKGTLKSIAVIGPRADSVYWDWYGGTPPHAITPLQGIRDALGPSVSRELRRRRRGRGRREGGRGFRRGDRRRRQPPDLRPQHGQGVDEGRRTPAPAPIRAKGREGRDRETLALSQEELVRKVHAANPRTVMVLVSSFPYTINWSQEHVPAIVHMAHSSQDEGWALAQVLFGDYNPGGHTVVTWPASMDATAADDGLRHPSRQNLHVRSRARRSTRSAMA